MGFLEPVFMGLAQLRANKLRSLLTLLGIMIGVSSVLGIVSLGEGLRRTVMNEFSSSGGATRIQVNSPKQWIEKDGRWVQRTWQEFLTNSDLAAFHAETDQIRTALPGVGGSAQLQYRKAAVSTNFIGTTEEFSAGLNWPVYMGRGLSADDVAKARRVCVLGDKTRQDLFATHDPLDKEVKLNGERYTVIGVLEPRIRFGRDEGEQILIPYTTVQKRITGNDHVHGITLFIRELEQVTRVVQLLERVLKRRHEHGEEFEIETSQNQMDDALNAIRILKAVAGGIAGISLLVGGIGIMNIMLVSVSERTREIGIRKALGAKPKDILLQFLAESIVLSLFGGLLGIGLGIGFGWAIAQVIYALAPGAPFSSVVGADSIVWALGFAWAVGLFFGVYPASRAAQLDPVEALQHE